MFEINSREKLPWFLLIAPLLLVLVYSMLSYISLVNVDNFFYTSMNIPVPEHGFLLLSWGGKNTAMLVALILGVLSRQRLPILIAMAVLLTGQLGDAYAGAQTGVDVFVTYIAMSLVAIQLVLMLVILRNK